ncbi:MAG: translation initiation factor IF-2 subunit beta [Candidatus Bilamarchaeaceae archaeon]
MDSEYERLLSELYSKLPEKIKPSERFEPPRFEHFVEGNKTVIKNFKAVCEKLRRNAALLTKFLSKELAVPAELQGERLVLQRRVSGDILDKKLEEFISKYVICKECKRPDTHIEDVGRGLRILVCESCGARTPIRE